MPQHIFYDSFAKVTFAFWNKYPNSACKHVRHVDIIDRQISNNGLLITKRILACENNNSISIGWLKRMIPDMVFTIEVSVVDPKNQTMLIRSRNLSSQSIMQMDESCVYKALCPKTTLYKQEIKFHATVNSLVNSKIENYAMAHAKEKSTIGIQAMEDILFMHRLLKNQRACANTCD